MRTSGPAFDRISKRTLKPWLLNREAIASTRSRRVATKPLIGSVAEAEVESANAAADLARSEFERSQLLASREAASGAATVAYLSPGSFLEKDAKHLARHRLE
jgi:hypothetical protein